MSFPSSRLARDKSRGTLNTNPLGRFTADRQMLANFENNELKKHFAEWLTKMTHVSVSTENFCNDIKDGTALCSVMSRIDGSGMKRFHNVQESMVHMRDFQRRDNIVGFQDACRRLALPDIVTTAEIEARNESKIISVLLHLQDLCDKKDIGPLPEEGGETEKDPLSKRSSSKRNSKKR